MLDGPSAVRHFIFAAFSCQWFFVLASRQTKVYVDTLWRDKIMSENPRRNLLKKAAALGMGALASAGNAFSLAEVAVSQAEQKRTAADFFPGFKRLSAKTSGATINFVTAGSGPPLLLMHGYPQTHIEWRDV